MTNGFLRMLGYLRVSTFGTKSENMPDATVGDVCNVAIKQGVFPLVYGALNNEEKAQLGANAQQIFFQGMVKNEQKAVGLSAVIKKLEENDIQYCVLKGGTVAVEYNLSECRLSGDIDLYVNPNDEKKVMTLLKSMNMEIEARTEGKQDFKASSPLTGLIEVHVMLYAKTFGEVVLKNKFGISEEFRDVKVSDILTVKALGVNDTLNFLTAHLLKHFVREGCGIRQVTDLLVFVDKHRNEIDFDKYFSELEELKFKNLILNIFGIGVKYFGLTFDDYSTDCIEELLDDFEAGENFGFGEVERTAFYELFIKNRTEKDKTVMKEIVGRKKRKLWKAVFLPTRMYLITRGFGYLEKSVLLYPVAYIHRFCRVIKNVILRKRKYKTAMGYAVADNEITSKRFELMKKLDVVD